jgi:hypothetical protein
MVLNRLGRNSKKDGTNALVRVKSVETPGILGVGDLEGYLGQRPDLNYQSSRSFSGYRCVGLRGETHDC